MIADNRERKAVEDLESAINTMSWNPKNFAKNIRLMHRTLQQTFFRSLISVIIEMARDDYPTDDRNKASHELAKRIVESGALDDTYLPFI